MHANIFLYTKINHQLGINLRHIYNPVSVICISRISVQKMLTYCDILLQEKDWWRFKISFTHGIHWHSYMIHWQCLSRIDLSENQFLSGPECVSNSSNDPKCLLTLSLSFASLFPGLVLIGFHCDGLSFAPVTH